MNNSPKKCITVNFLVMALLLSATSCRNTINDDDWQNPHPSFNDSLVFSKVATKEFRLDSATILRNENSQYLDKTTTLVSYNSENSDLLFFDYSTGELKQKINLVKIGIPPLEKGSLKQYSFNVVRYDSIFFYDQKKKQVFLFDTSLNLKRTYAVASDKNNFKNGRVLAGNILPVDKNYIYVPSPPGRDPLVLNAPIHDNLFLSISIQTGKTMPFVRYPPIYRKALWGYLFHAFYLAYNDSLGKIIVSYPAIHSIHLIDSSGNDSKSYAGGSSVNQLRPVRWAGQKLDLKKDEEIKNFLSQKRYGNVLYDGYRNLTYRVVTSAVPEKDFSISKNKGYQRQPFSIIILDSNLKKVGEFAFDANKYSTNAMFVSKDGLCVPSTKSDDDRLIFDVFKIVQK